MTKIENKERVTHIVMHPTAYTKCRIGQDWYKCCFEIHFEPGACYPDYMEVNAYIMSEIDGKELNIEEAAYMLFFHLRQYAPKRLKVINHITNCKTHFDVDVTVE